MAKTGTVTLICSSASTRARGGVAITRRHVDWVDFNFSFFRSEMLLGKDGFFFSAPLSLSGMESEAFIVEAMAAISRAERLLEKA